MTHPLSVITFILTRGTELIVNSTVTKEQSPVCFGSVLHHQAGEDVEEMQCNGGEVRCKDPFFFFKCKLVFLQRNFSALHFHSGNRAAETSSGPRMCSDLF